MGGIKHEISSCYSGIVSRRFYCLFSFSRAISRRFYLIQILHILGDVSRRYYLLFIFPGPFLEVILSPMHLFLCFPSLPRCPDGKDLSLYFCIDLPSIILAQPSFTNFRVLPSKDYIQTHQSKLLQRTPTVHTRVHKTYKIRSLQRLGHLVDSIKPELLCQYTVSLTAFLCCHFHPPPVLFSSVAPIYFCSFKLF